MHKPQQYKSCLSFSANNISKMFMVQYVSSKILLSNFSCLTPEEITKYKLLCHVEMTAWPILYYLLIVGLFGGFNPKTEKSSDIGAGSFFPVVSSIDCLKLLWLSSILSPCNELPSSPSRPGITLLVFLGGDKTIGPSFGFKSDALVSFLGGGLGSLSGIVHRGGQEKYLKWKKKDYIRDK